MVQISVKRVEKFGGWLSQVHRLKECSRRYLKEQISTFYTENMLFLFLPQCMFCYRILKAILGWWGDKWLNSEYFKLYK